MANTNTKSVSDSILELTKSKSILNEQRKRKRNTKNVWKTCI